SIALSDVARLNRTLAAGTGFHLAIATVVACLALFLGPAALGIVAPAGPLAPHARTVFGCTLGTVLLRTTLSAYRGVVSGAQRIDAPSRIGAAASDRKSTRLNSSHQIISYAVFCLEKKN